MPAVNQKALGACGGDSYNETGNLGIMKYAPPFGWKGSGVNDLFRQSETVGHPFLDRAMPGLCGAVNLIPLR